MFPPLQARALYCLVQCAEEALGEEFEELGLRAFAKVSVMQAAFKEMTKRSHVADSRYNLAVGLKAVHKWVRGHVGTRECMLTHQYVKRILSVLSGEKKDNRGRKTQKNVIRWKG